MNNIFESQNELLFIINLFLINNDSVTFNLEVIALKIWLVSLLAIS